MTPKINLGTILSVGTAASGSVLQAMCTVPDISAGMIGGAAGGAMLLGLGAGLWSAVIDRNENARLAVKNLLVNEDLARATANALQQRLTEASGKMNESAQATDRARLKKIAKDAPRWWMEIACEQAGNEFDGLREPALVDGLTLLLSNLEQQRPDYVPPQPITQEIWADLLRRLDQEIGGDEKLSEAAIHAVAGVLHEQVLKDIYLVVKHDLEHGGRAYAAISLRFSAETLAEVRALKSQLDNLPVAINRELIQFFNTHAKLDDTLRQLAESAAVLSELKSLSPNLRSALRETELRLHDSLKSVLRKLDTVEGKIDSLTENRIKRDVENRLKQEAEKRQKIAPSRLLRSGNKGPEILVGRESELADLDSAWNGTDKKNVVTIVAWGGVGKTSLVAHWQARLAQRNYDGADYFDWSFYSQGSREQSTVSADTFTAAALEFFGDLDMAKSATSPWDKGARLAQLIGQRRSLLVLDGLEPLQYPPTYPLAGQLKDPALTALLKGLAAKNLGMCLVTTRENVADLTPFHNTTASEWKLQHLSIPAGIKMLKKLGVRGAQENFEQLVKDVKGHTLTLNLLGRYLTKAHGGDIRKRDLVKFEKADEKIQGSHAFKTIEAYENWFSEGGEDGVRALAILRLLGFFDRPADAGCLAALRKPRIIPGLTDAFLKEREDFERLLKPPIAITEEDWNLTLSSLSECGLVSLYQTDTDQTSIDTHPLIRDYFAKQLREKNPTAWRAGHQRLYEHLCANAPDKPQPTLEDLQPLYQAVAHGCRAELHEMAWAEVYFQRIIHGLELYSTRRLGAFGADLGALACFYDEAWMRLSPFLSESARDSIPGLVAFRLRALGRLSESLEITRACLDIDVHRSDWNGAVIDAMNLSELELTLGKIAEAMASADRAVEYADQVREKTNPDWRVHARVRLASALHQMGKPDSAELLFSKAEAMQREDESKYPLLFGLSGFEYCDLLLFALEPSAWRTVLSPHNKNSKLKAKVASCQVVMQRGAKMLEWRLSNDTLLNIALDDLVVGRAKFYEAILTGSSLETCCESIQRALDGVRHAGTTDFVPLALFTRAWLRFLTGSKTGPESAQADLDEAWEIAERGPMRLFLADIHLHRARLFYREAHYPWSQNPDGTPRGPEDDLAAAEKLINECGYHRRDEELADAKQAILT